MLRKWAKVPLKIGRAILSNTVKCFVKGGCYMEIGNKILELRKQKNLSQEQLAEKMGVARQTISKWELGETSPDLEQSKQLSQLFNVSLDDLTNNDIKNVLITKVNNTEKSLKTIINVLKIIFLILCILVIICISIIFFQDYFHAEPVGETTIFSCTINNEEYMYKIQKYGTPVTLDLYTNDRNLNIDATLYADDNLLIEDIQESVVLRGGSCGQEKIQSDD